MKRLGYLLLTILLIDLVQLIDKCILKHLSKLIWDYEICALGCVNTVKLYMKMLKSNH